MSLNSGMPAEGADPNCNMPFLKQRESNNEKNHAMDLDMIFPYFCSYFIVQASHTVNSDIIEYRGIPPTERTLKEGCCRDRQLVFKENNITTVSKVSQAERGKTGIWILLFDCLNHAVVLPFSFFLCWFQVFNLYLVWLHSCGLFLPDVAVIPRYNFWSQWIISLINRSST